MKPFELRLAELQCRNARHVKNLRAFIADKPRFDRLDPEDQTLLLEQLELMSALDEVLKVRCRRLKIPIE